MSAAAGETRIINGRSYPPGSRLPQRLGKYTAAELGLTDTVRMKLYPAERELILLLRDFSKQDAENITAELFEAAERSIQG